MQESREDRQTGEDELMSELIRRSLLALDLPDNLLERAAARARLRRIFLAGSRLGDAGAATSG